MEKSKELEERVSDLEKQNDEVSLDVLPCTVCMLSHS